MVSAVKFGALLRKQSHIGKDNVQGNSVYDVMQSLSVHHFADVCETFGPINMTN